MFEIETNTWEKTEHKALIGDSAELIQNTIPDNSVALVVTSPPYPMVEMWDQNFKEKLKGASYGDFDVFWDDMLTEIDLVLSDCFDIVMPGGWIAVNMGNALRKAPYFRMFDNISAVSYFLLGHGWDLFPPIIWHKNPNKPNSFMGPGMIPGAYVTLEHEMIIIGRKGENRVYSEEDKKVRRDSAFFWSERNTWFSSIWRVAGAQQGKEDRTGAYSLEIPFRLINMLTILGDTVFDPYLGTGTTALAAAVSGRNSIGVEINPNREEAIRKKMLSAPEVGKKRQTERLNNQRASNIMDSSSSHRNSYHGFKVKSAQEEHIKLCSPKKVSEFDHLKFSVTY